tara:strand:- start:2249 stop:2803 length:555 start_codon:yes stop_codon:yes gene_type:complete
MKDNSLIYKRINKIINENGRFDELVILDIENIYGCNSIYTKNKERKMKKIRETKKRLKNFENYLNLTRRSLIIISANRRLLEDLDMWYFDESPPVEILISAKGEDGADLALIDSAEYILNSEHINKFKKIIIASGDHIFTPLIKRLKNEKFNYKTLSVDGKLSNKILEISEDHINLDRELEYAV